MSCDKQASCGQRPAASEGPVRAIIVRCLAPTLLAALLSSCALRQQPAVPAASDAPIFDDLTEPAFSTRWGEFGATGWMGPDWWPHPVAGWHSSTNGAACTLPAETVGLLALSTRAFDASAQPYEITLEVTGMRAGPNAVCGLLLGLDHPFGDPAARLDADHPAVLASISGSGAVKLQIVTNILQASATAAERPGAATAMPARIALRLYGRAMASRGMLVLSCIDAASGNELGRASLWQLAPRATQGHLAVLVRGAGPALRIAEFAVRSTRLTSREAGAAGPILGAWFRYDGNELHLTAQLMPMPADAATGARLQILKSLDWHTVAIGQRSATDERLRFHVSNWPSAYDMPYRIAYDLTDLAGTVHTFYWGGTVPRLSLATGTLLLAVLPSTDAVTPPLPPRPRASLWPFLDARLPHLVAHAPDLVCFQSTNGAPLLRAQQAPTQADYDWLLTMRDILRDTPALGVDISRTRHGRLYVGMLASSTAPELTDPEADWQRWRGADFQVLLAPDTFTRIALLAPPPNPSSVVNPALATAGSGLGFVIANTLSGNVAYTRQRYADTFGSNARETVEGWPLALPALDTRHAIRNLPAIQFNGIMDPVLQTIDAATGQLEHAQRCHGNLVLPRVATAGPYLLRIGDPDTGRHRDLEALTPLAPHATETLTITFDPP
jgi:hypothetical protein